MGSSELCLDEFLEFLADRASDVVGYSGPSFFRNPVAEWLAVKFGGLVAVDVDGYVFGASHRQYALPRWGRLLVSSLERFSPASVTGEMVFLHLSQLESTLLSSSR